MKLQECPFHLYCPPSLYITVVSLTSTAASIASSADRVTGHVDASGADTAALPVVVVTADVATVDEPAAVIEHSGAAEALAAERLSRSGGRKYHSDIVAESGQ